MKRVLDFLYGERRLSTKDYRKIINIGSSKLYEFLADSIKLCNPSKIFVCDDSAKDILYIRDRAVAEGEETKLAISGHTFHFDAYGDQGRDKKNTLVLVS